MRPIISLHHVVGLIMLAYAAGITITPTGGAIFYLTTRTILTAPVIAGVFAVCGGLILIMNPPPTAFALLTTPILLYAIAGIFFFAEAPLASAPAVVAHIGLWLVINAALIEKARGE